MGSALLSDPCTVSYSFILYTGLHMTVSSLVLTVCVCVWCVCVCVCVQKGAYWRRTCSVLFDNPTDEDTDTRNLSCARLSCNRVCVQGAR